MVYTVHTYVYICGITVHGYVCVWHVLICVHMCSYICIWYVYESICVRLYVSVYVLCLNLCAHLQGRNMLVR